MRTCAKIALKLWTIDIDPVAVRWGAKNRHMVGGVREIDQKIETHFFAAAIMNGVLGYGIDDSVRAPKRPSARL